MGKYDPLKSFLLSSGADEVALRFDEIEALIGAPLPPSQKHPAWWSNNPSNNPMTQVWLDAGYRTERLDLGARRVLFRRKRRTDRLEHLAPAPGVIERLQAVLAGTAKVPSGGDLTEPTGEAWDAEGS